MSSEETIDDTEEVSQEETLPESPRTSQIISSTMNLHKNDECSDSSSVETDPEGRNEVIDHEMPLRTSHDPLSMLHPYLAYADSSEGEVILIRGPTDYPYVRDVLEMPGYGSGCYELTKRQLAGVMYYVRAVFGGGVCSRQVGH